MVNLNVKTNEKLEKGSNLQPPVKPSLFGKGNVPHITVIMQNAETAKTYAMTAERHGTLNTKYKISELAITEHGAETKGFTPTQPANDGPFFVLTDKQFAELKKGGPEAKAIANSIDRVMLREQSFADVEAKPLERAWETKLDARDKTLTAMASALQQAQNAQGFVSEHNTLTPRSPATQGNKIVL